MGVEYAPPSIKGITDITPFHPERNIWRGIRSSDELEIVLKGERPLLGKDVRWLEGRIFTQLHTKHRNFFPEDSVGPRGIVPYLGLVETSTGSYLMTTYLEPTDHVVNGSASLRDTLGFVASMTDTLGFIHRHDPTVHPSFSNRHDFIGYDIPLENWVDLSVPEKPLPVLVDVTTFTSRTWPTVPLGIIERASPEQLRGERDTTADVYSIATNLYRLVARREPFDVPQYEMLPDYVRAPIVADFKERHQPSFDGLEYLPRPAMEFLRRGLGPSSRRPSLLESRRFLTEAMMILENSRPRLSPDGRPLPLRSLLG